jgi:hypothetical protein
VDLIREGFYFRGNREYQRQNYGKAYEAFESAGNYRDSLFQMADIYIKTSQSPEDCIERLFAAYDAGDKKPLVLLMAFLSHQDSKHPRLEEITQDLNSKREAEDPTVLGQLALFCISEKSLTEGLRYLKIAALGGDIYAKQMLGEIIFDRAWWKDLYELLLSGEAIDFEGFPLKPVLDPIGEIDPIFQDEITHNFSDETIQFLSWLFDQGSLEQRHYRSQFTKYMSNLYKRGLDVIAEYDQEVKNSFGYPGSMAQDLELMIILAKDLLSCKIKPDLGIYEVLLERHGVKDLLDELRAEIMSSESKKQADDSHVGNGRTSYFYKSNFSFNQAITQIPIDYSAAEVDRFITHCKNFNFAAAEEDCKELLNAAKAGDESAAGKVANILEFLERVRFEFDFLPQRLITNMKNQVVEILTSKNAEILKESLRTFTAKGERPYFMDDFELILTGRGK